MDVEDAKSKLARLTDQLDQVTADLAQTRDFAKATRRSRVIDVARRLLMIPGGFDVIYARSQQLEQAGLFAGTDWAFPEILQPALTTSSLRSQNRETAILEVLSELRLLAVAQDQFFHPSISTEQARHFLNQVLALNLDLLLGMSTEASRSQSRAMTELIPRFYNYLLQQLGPENLLDRLVEEVWRILAQRPIQTDSVKNMISQMAIAMQNSQMGLSGSGHSAGRLVSALFAPTNGCKEDPGLDAYKERLSKMDANTLQQEATGFARAMHDTGLVSPYHPVFLRFILNKHSDLVSTALGLSSTGLDALLCYRLLIETLIKEAIFPETAQAVYGLARMLEYGVLYAPPVAPSLWRQISLPLSDSNKNLLTTILGDAVPPRVRLLAGVLNVLGQPFGVGQGNNPTCQSARAISMWAYNDPDYLLQMIAWAARDDEIIMHFEGKTISSKDLQQGMTLLPPADVDAVSMILVPHLDRIYVEMGRLCAGRGEDPHRWINPEFHGWWVGRGFNIAVDVGSGHLRDYEDFIAHFYRCYHPYYNGNQPVIHPQPAGIAVTDSLSRFIGWHAITLLRVALDQEGVMRMYFYNPNNDSGQNWGQDIQVSTEGHGERYGESSLPFDQIAARIYIFHYDALEKFGSNEIPQEEVQKVADLGRASWAVNRVASAKSS